MCNNSIILSYLSRFIIFTLMLFFILHIVSCGQKRQSSICETYSESEDPAPDLTANWEGVRPGLHASMGSVNEHYFKSRVPQISTTTTWTGTAWRGEKVSAQLVLWSGEPVNRVHCQFTDFISEQGQRLPPQIAQIRFVRYVLTDEFADACSDRKPENYAVHLYPDMLDNVSCLNMEGKSVRPVWITIKTPPEANPGTYKSTMNLYAGDEKIRSFNFILEILPRRLPPANEWMFHLDLWQNPYAVARVHGVEPWSEEHWTILKPVMKLLAEAGQKVITTSITKRPWAGQTYDQFESMIVWKKKKDGSWEFDYSIFDNWVNFMMDLGIKKQINCYSLLPWTSEVSYFDEISGKEEVVKVEPGSDDYISLWSPFLKKFRVHLEQRGWNNITNIAMDECEPEEMRLMLKMLDEQAPEFGIALADDKKSYKIYPDHIKDLCVSYNAIIDKEDLEYRKSKGYPSTYYVCCVDQFPNTFTFSPPAEATFISWYAVAAGFDGFLRWSYCSWVKDPLKDSRFKKWPAGDTYLVYPDARSSIRFERLVEGIQDAEKIRILREFYEKDGSAAANQKLKQLNDTIAQFNILEEPDDTNALINQGKKVVEMLSR